MQMQKLFSIIIPTYNGGKTLSLLLNKIISFVHQYSYEIIIIDSGSTDKTIDIIYQFKKKVSFFKVVKINKKYFDHGNTRNLGVRMAKGKFICFFTQDALPEDKNFFRYYLEDFKISKTVVAIFGKNITYPGTPLLQKIESDCRWDMLDKFANKKGVLIQNLSDPFIPYSAKNYLIWYFFSNTSSCYRRSFLIKNPFPKTNYGEDMMIGKIIIEKKLSKVYDSRCYVIHSHKYNFFEYYSRQKDSLILRFKKIGVNEIINIRCKILKILQMNINLTKKVYYFFLLFFYYLIKAFVFVEIMLKTIFAGKDFYKNGNY